MGGVSGIDGMVNSFNQFTYTAAAVQGAAETMVPAVNAVGGAINQVAGVFTGDTYQQTQPYPPPVYPVSTSGSGFNLISSILAGGITGGMTHNQTADALKSFKSQGMGAGFKNLGMATLKSAGIGALVSGLVSGVQNGAAAARGEMSKADAGGNVAADTVGGILAGAGAGIGAGIGSLALRSFGVAGLPLTVAAVAVGALGSVGVNHLFNSSGLRDNIAGTMRKAFGGTDPATQMYYQQPNYGY
jgi:hypothetical protein